MSSQIIRKRNATGAFATPIDPPQLRAHPRAHQQKDDNENLIDETAKMAKRLTEGPSQTQCVFGNEDIAPGTSIAGVSGRLGDPKLASMQKMVFDSVPEGSQVKIIYLITKIKEDGNNDLRAGTANNAAAAQAGPSEVNRFVRQNNPVQDRARAQAHQHIQGEDHDEEDEDVSLRPRKRRRASCRVSPLHMSPRGLKTEKEDEEEREELIKEEVDDEVDDEVKEEVDDEVKEEIDDEALFFAAPDEVINRSISSSYAMHRMTPSLYGLLSGNSFPSPARTAQPTNASDNNDDSNEDDGEESFQVRYTGGFFEDYFVAHAGAFPTKDPDPRL
ncbi:uncharacterized protein BDZ83DRAFT_655727 [Colletotrichum acutatum]|uniref:Uncharacterized protein n=1 Tax=Glomerella acutata TaxID=27357 RepID=A0AAD8XAQ7_GLOAC|nr:uncharacterized protein BDZ83DRAFT_655727 [Colletotrichum acutatum]KAK1715553.1 hypothetical protein BDZ83DRAFT_655727 [Colletotrichum acutatum]